MLLVRSSNYDAQILEGSAQGHPFHARECGLAVPHSAQESLQVHSESLRIDEQVSFDVFRSAQYNVLIN